MARNKEKLISFEMSQAFLDRSKQEMLKLKEHVAKSLKEDIKSLLDDDSHSDLLITNGSDVVYAHKCILKSRSRHYWQDHWLTKTLNGSGNEIDVLEIIGLTGKQLDEFIRDLYVINDPAWLMEEYLHFFPGERRSSLSADTDSQQLVLPNHVERLSGDHSEQIIRLALAEDASVLEGSSLPSADLQNIIGCEVNTTTESAVDRFDQFASLQDDFSSSVSTEHLRVDYCEFTDHGTVSYNEGEDFKCHQMLITESRQSAELDLDDQLEAQLVVDSVNKSSRTHALQKIILESNITDIVNESNFGISCNASKSVIKDVIRNDSTISANIMEHSETFIVAPKNSIFPDGGENLLHDVKILSSSVKNDCNFLNNSSKTSSVLQEEVLPASPLSCKVTEKTIDSIFSNDDKANFDTVSYETCSPLGDDLLQLYLNELDCDCCLAVDGIRFLVHKCLLSARSEYFQAMLCGQWCESKMETINLEGVTSQAIKQLLLFLYGGVLELTTPCDLTDLFIVADMYGIASLKNVLAFYVKKDLCHFFHRPCFVCTGKAAEALSLCYNFNMSDLQGRVVKWVAKYFTKIWPTKSFASLPDVVQDLSLEGIKSQMNIRNVLDIIMECDKLTTSLPRIKWTESVLCLLTQLMDTSIEFTSSHFIEVISTQEFQQWAKVASWKAGALEEIFNTVIDSLPINMSCLIYETLINLESVLSDQDTSDIDVVGLLQAMIKRCEKFFKIHINQIMRTKEWAQFPKSLQSKIMDSSAYLFLDVSLSSAKSKMSVKHKVSSSTPGTKQSPKLPHKSEKITASGTHSTTNIRKSSQHTVQLRNHSATQRKERPKSSVTTSEQAKKLTKSEKIPTAINMFRLKCRNTNANINSASFSASEPHAETSSNGLVDNTEAVVSEQHVESHQCKKIVSDISGSASSSTKLLPSKIPLLTRSPNAGRPKSMLNLHNVNAKSLDSQNSNWNATPKDMKNISFADKDEKVISYSYDESHAYNLLQQDVSEADDINNKPDIVNCVTSSHKTEPDLSSLPLISPADESEPKMEATNQGKTEKVSSEEKPKVNVVTMSKTLNIGFTVPDE